MHPHFVRRPASEIWARIGRTLLRAPTDQIDANIYHLVMEVSLYGALVGTAVNLMQVYVVRLGASSLLVSAITYGPALVCILTQFPVARMLARTGKRRRWLLATSALYRLGFLVIALLPFVTRERLAELTVAVLMINALPFVITVTTFTGTMADAAPPDRIPQMLSWRIAGWGLTSTLATLVAAILLSRLAFPIGFQMIFLAGMAISMAGVWHLAQVVTPDPERVRGAPVVWYREFGPVLAYPGFGRFVLGALVVCSAYGMVMPLLPLYWVRTLGASDSEVSLAVTVYSALLVFGSLSMRRLLRRLGRERVIAFAALGYALYPLLVSFTGSIFWVMPWAAVGGLFYSAITVTLFDNMVASCPEHGREPYIAVYNMSLNIALFVGPLLASGLVAVFGGAAPGLRVAAGLSVIGAIILLPRIPGWKGGQINETTESTAHHSN